MQFNERELVDLFVCAEEHGFLSRFSWQREYQLEPYRFDLYLCSKNKREHQVIEAKIVADVHAAIQLIKYRDLLKNDIEQNSFFINDSGEHCSRPHMVVGSLVAQHFTSDCLYLCRELGVPCSIVAPINKSEAKIVPVIAHSKFNYRKQLGLKTKNSDFIKNQPRWSYDHG